MRMDGARREITRLRRKLAKRDFRASAPLLDPDGLPMWGGGEPLTNEAYAKALDQDIPDDDLTEAELATRERLSPYSEVFETLQRAEEEEEETANT